MCTVYTARINFSTIVTMGNSITWILQYELWTTAMHVCLCMYVCVCVPTLYNIIVHVLESVAINLSESAYHLQKMLLRCSLS